MDSTLKFKVTDAQSHRDKDLVGVGALAMASEKNQKLPVSDPLLSDETHKRASAITTKGAQAAISYMLTAGFFFGFFFPLCFHFLHYFVMDIFNVSHFLFGELSVP